MNLQLRHEVSQYERVPWHKLYPDLPEEAHTNEVVEPSSAASADPPPTQPTGAGHGTSAAEEPDNSSRPPRRRPRETLPYDHLHPQDRHSRRNARLAGAQGQTWNRSSKVRTPKPLSPARRPTRRSKRQRPREGPDVAQSPLHTIVPQRVKTAGIIQERQEALFTVLEAIGRNTETPDGPTIILQKATIASVVPLQSERKHASRIATAARSIIINSCTPAPLKLSAIMILVHATVAEQTLVTTSLGLFIAQLKMQPVDELKTRVSKRLRHGIRAILTKLGLRGEAALLIALKEQPPRAVTELTRLDIEAWSTTAMAKLATMPLSPQEWLAVLKDADHTTGVKKYNAEKGFAIWRHAPAWAEPPREPRSFVTWNLWGSIGGWW